MRNHAVLRIILSIFKDFANDFFKKLYGIFDVKMHIADLPCNILINCYCFLLSEAGKNI